MALDDCLFLTDVIIDLNTIDSVYTVTDIERSLFINISNYTIDINIYYQNIHI